MVRARRFRRKDKSAFRKIGLACQRMHRGGIQPRRLQKYLQLVAVERPRGKNIEVHVRKLSLRLKRRRKRCESCQRELSEFPAGNTFHFTIYTAGPLTSSRGVHTIF